MLLKTRSRTTERLPSMPVSQTLTRQETVSRITSTSTGVIRFCQAKGRTVLPVNGIRKSTRACVQWAGWRNGMDRLRMEASLERSKWSMLLLIHQLPTFCGVPQHMLSQYDVVLVIGLPAKGWKVKSGLWNRMTLWSSVCWSPALACCFFTLHPSVAIYKIKAHNNGFVFVLLLVMNWYANKL